MLFSSIITLLHMNGKKSADKSPSSSSMKDNKTPQMPATVHQESNVKYEDLNFVDTSQPVWNYSILYDDDVATFQAGTHYQLYKKLGSKKLEVLGTEGFYFCVWAPNATAVSVIGNFNNWRAANIPYTALG